MHSRLILGFHIFICKKQLTSNSHVLILFQRGNTRGHECLKSNACVSCVSTWQYTCHSCLQLRPYDLQQNNPTADTELIIVSEERRSVATESGHEPAKTKATSSMSNRFLPRGKKRLKPSHLFYPSPACIRKRNRKY